MSAETSFAWLVVPTSQERRPMRIHLFCSDVTAVRKREICSHLFSPFSCSVVFGLVFVVFLVFGFLVFAFLV